MGGTQSAERDGKEDVVAEEESGQVDDVQTEISEDKPLKNNGQMSEIHGKTDFPAAEVNGHCEDEVVAEVCETISAIVSPKEDVPETEEPLKDEETPLENVEINEKESPDADEAAPPDVIETEAKLNEINDGFRRFFSNIGFKLTVKKGSGEKADIGLDVPIEASKGEPSSPDDVKDTTQEASENAEQNIDLNMAQETSDNDSTTCPTLTDMTSEDIKENAEEKNTETTEAKEEVASDEVVEALTTSTSVGEEEKILDKDTTAEKEPDATSSPGPEEEVMSPIKKFFTTGIFSGLRKKKKPEEEEKTTDETIGKELVDMEKHEAVAKTEEIGQEQELIKEEISPGVETAAVEVEQKENVLQEEILPVTSDAAPTADAPEIRQKSPPEEPSTVIVNEPEILSSQEKIKVQDSPLKRLLSASSLKKLSKKQKGRKSNDSKVTDSGEHVSDHLSSTESAEYQREESPARSAGEVAEEGDGTWASFKKLVTPKKRMKRSSPSNEEAVISGSLEEPKPSEEEQISDLNTEEIKKRKNSWDAFLCGSGKRRSRKTSDSEDETPATEGDGKRPDDESRHTADSPVETPSNDGDEQAGSPSEGDGGSTWKSLKKLVTPKKKVKDEEESKDHIPSDSEINKDESSFSIKKLIPGRKKRTSAEKQEQVSSDEADRVGSDDEDSETPAVVPLSEFDMIETDDQVQTQAVIESHISKAEDHEPQQNLSGQMTEPVPSSDSLHDEPKGVQDNDNALEKQASKVPASNEEFEDLTELISKHQQLSDIPEEGIIDESMATLASVTEEAARDDTIAEDLIELTSEAVTAPEPVDITLADETEMVSAVSQLTESSKTSGNTTPVPAEYDVKETDVLLHQVVETISVTPNAISVCLNEPRPETIVGSVSPQILETSVVRQEATILEAHQKSDATAICTGLNAEEFDATNELLATSQTECVSEVTEAISTELVSEVTTEEFDTAGIAEDEIHHASVSQAQGSVKEFESTDKSQPLVECVSEGNEAVSIELLPEDEEIGAVEVSIDGASQVETQSTELESHDADSTAAVIDETKNEAVVQTDQALEENQDQIIENASDQVKVEDQDQIPEVVEELQPLTTVQVATLNSEQGTAQVLQKQVISEDILAAETDNAISSVIDESKQAVCLTEVNVVAEKEDELPSVVMDAAQVAHAPVPERIQAGVNVMAEIENKLQACTALHVVTANVEEGGDLELEKQVIVGDIPTSVTDVTESEAVVQLDQALETKEDQVIENTTEDVSQDVQVEDEVHVPEVVDELQTLIAAHIDLINAEESSVQVLVTSEDTPVPNAESVTASGTSEVENETVVLTDQVLLEKEHITLENGTHVPQHIITEGEGQIADVAHELQTLTAVHVATVTSDASSAQVLEEQVISEDLLTPCVDKAFASVTAEPIQEVHLTEDNVQAEKEGELPGVEMEAAAAQHAPVAQVNTCSLNDVIASIPDAAMVDTSHILEPLIDIVTHEVESQEPVTIITPMMKDDMTETAEEGTVVMMMHVPSVQFEDDHRIQVQVVDDDVTSAETIVETKVNGIKEVIDVCHEMDEVENLSATLEIEEEIIDEADKVIIQEVTQHEKEKLPEVLPEAVVVQVCVQDESVVLGQEVVKPPIVVPEPSEKAESELSEVADKQEDSTLRERPAEGAAVTSVSSSVTEQEVSHVPGSLDVSIHGLKEDLEETKDEPKKESDGDKIIEDSICSSEESVAKKLKEDITEEQRPQTTPCQMVKPSNTGLVVPQNTGLISSVGNVESPSSLSLEFKLNIQFGQVKAPAPPPPVIEGTEPLKQIDVSEVGVQVTEAVEPVRQIQATEGAETQKQTELSEVAAQTTQITAPVAQLDSTESVTILTSQPALFEVVIRAMETTEPVKQIKSVEKVIASQPELPEASVQATQPVRPIETTATAVILTVQTVQSGVDIQETKAVKPVQQIEEERDQDVWLDAEENISTTEGAGKSPPEALASKSQTENDQAEKGTLGQEHETAQHAHAGEGESQKEMPKTRGTGELKGEGEDFAPALEQPETATASVTALEMD